MLNEEMLRENWQFIRKDVASGVDRVSAKEFEQNLEGMFFADTSISENLGVLVPHTGICA